MQYDLCWYHVLEIINEQVVLTVDIELARYSTGVSCEKNHPWLALFWGGGNYSSIR